MGQGEALRANGALSDRERSATRFRLIFLVIFAGFTVGATIPVLRVDPFGVVVDPDGTTRLMDFASHRAFTCAVWSGELLRHGTNSVYTLGAHLQATEAFTGLPARVALPFGYSPTMLWILGPTCMVGERIAFTAWVLAGLLALAAAVLRGRVPWTAMLPFTAPLAIYTLALGQTAVLGTAGLLWLMMQDRETSRDASAWTTAAVLWLLSAKPPVAVTAAVALVARRRWRPVVAAAGFTIVSTLLVVPWLGPGWVGDYVALVGRYDRVRLPAAFAWSIVPESMSNLRAALSVDLGVRDDVAVEVANVLWGIALAALVVTAWWRSLAWSRVWTFAVLAYLLLCPHVSATENLALCCVLAVLGVPRTAGALAAVAFVMVGLWLAPVIPPAAVWRHSVLFFGMLATFGLFLADTRLGRGEVPV